VVWNFFIITYRHNSKIITHFPASCHGSIFNCWCHNELFVGVWICFLYWRSNSFSISKNESVVRLITHFFSATWFCAVSIFAGYKTVTLFELGVSHVGYRHDTDLYNYIKLCQFFKLLSMSTCQYPFYIRCPYLYQCFIVRWIVYMVRGLMDFKLGFVVTLYIYSF
jgi:hypothetical protein